MVHTRIKAAVARAWAASVALGAAGCRGVVARVGGALGLGHDSPCRPAHAGVRRARVAALRTLFCALLGVAAPAPAWALQGVACEPEWAALAQVLLPQGQWFVATHVKQDPHHIEARPALIAQVRRADVLLCTGAGLESGWLPVLQERAGNSRVQEGAAGMFYATQGLALLGAGGASFNPFAGDVHPEGNPHIQVDPHQLLAVARALAGFLARQVPEQAAPIAERARQFELAWLARIKGWEQRAAPLQGRAVVAQHGTFAYLWRWLGMTQVADLEPKPGLAPTPGHLEQLRQRFRERPPAAIVIAQHHDPRPARWLASQFGPSVPLRVLPATVPDPMAPDALGRWFDSVLDTLLAPVVP